MKALTLAAIAIMTVVLTVSAYSQGLGGGKAQREPDKPIDTAKKKAEEKTYNDAVSRIPTAKEEYDPWAGVRPKTEAPPAKPRR